MPPRPNHVSPCIVLAFWKVLSTQYIVWRAASATTGTVLIRLHSFLSIYWAAYLGPNGCALEHSTISTFNLNCRFVQTAQRGKSSSAALSLWWAQLQKLWKVWGFLPLKFIRRPLRSNSSYSSSWHKLLHLNRLMVIWTFMEVLHRFTVPKEVRHCALKCTLNWDCQTDHPQGDLSEYVPLLT